MTITKPCSLCGRPMLKTAAACDTCGAINSVRTAPIYTVPPKSVCVELYGTDNLPW